MPTHRDTSTTNNPVLTAEQAAKVARRKADAEVLQNLLDTSDVTENPDPVDEGKAFDIIEKALDKFALIQDARSWIMSSIAWSYAFKSGRNVLRLLDLDQPMAEATEYANEERMEALSELRDYYEGQAETQRDIFNWAASQTSSRLVPEVGEVARRMQTKQSVSTDEVQEHAMLFNVSITEAREVLEEAAEATYQQAVKHSDKLEHALVPYISNVGPRVGFELGPWDLVSILELIEKKAADYAYRAQLRGAKTRVPRIKKELAANHRIFMEIAEETGPLASEARREAELQQESRAGTGQVA